MRRRRLGYPGKAFVAVLSIACCLAFTQGAFTTVLAAEEDWQQWPKRPVEPGAEPGYKAGEKAGAKASYGLEAGTGGWIAAGVAAVVVIVVAASGGSGGGSSSTTPAHH